MNRRYQSKKDAWLIVILVVAVLITLISLLLTLLTLGALQNGGWVSVVVVIVAWAFVFSLIWPLYYEITPSVLFVRSGILH